MRTKPEEIEDKVDKMRLELFEVLDLPDEWKDMPWEELVEYTRELREEFELAMRAIGNLILNEIEVKLKEKANGPQCE